MTFYKDNSNFCVEMRILESKGECKETIEKLHAMLRALFSSSNSRMISPCREIYTCLKKPGLWARDDFLSVRGLAFKMGKKKNCVT